jgi:hypothetical protein
MALQTSLTETGAKDNNNNTPILSLCVRLAQQRVASCLVSKNNSNSSYKQTQAHNKINVGHDNIVYIQTRVTKNVFTS